MALRAALAVAAVLVAGASARADVPRAGAIAIAAGVGQRDDVITVNDARREIRLGAGGSALSSLAAGGEWFGARAHVGLAAQIGVERFGLREAGTDAPLVVHGGFGAAGLALRAPVGRATFGAELGYGYLQLPVAIATSRPDAAGRPAIAGGVVRAHGPVIELRAALAARDWLGLELGLAALPLGLGARYDGDPITPRRFSGDAALALGHLDAGPIALAAVARYELARTHAAGGPVVLAQLRHEIAFGVRATFAGAPTTTPAPTGGRLRLLVREAGTTRALAGATVRVAGGPAFRTDARGEALLAGLDPGPRELELEAPGYAPGRETVEIPTLGEARAEISVARDEAGRPGVISGRVLGAGAGPVAAEVTVLELGTVVRADAAGAFRLELLPGEYTITITAPGFVEQRKLVRASGGAEVIYDLVLEPAGAPATP